MIGECNKDIMGTMKAEHHSVAAGYGFSDGVFVTSSYRVQTTPRKEWDFVVGAIHEMPAGVDKVDGRERGNRKSEDPQQLLDEAAERITASFAQKGIERMVTREELKEINLLLEEIIALRL